MVPQHQPVIWDSFAFFCRWPNHRLLKQTKHCTGTVPPGEDDDSWLWGGGGRVWGQWLSPPSTPHLPNCVLRRKDNCQLFFGVPELCLSRNTQNIFDLDTLKEQSPLWRTAVPRWKFDERYKENFNLPIASTSYATVTLRNIIPWSLGIEEG